MGTGDFYLSFFIIIFKRAEILIYYNFNFSKTFQSNALKFMYVLLSKIQYCDFPY